MRWTALERRILAANGGRPWSAPDVASVDGGAARAAYADVRRAFGFAEREGRWGTLAHPDRSYTANTKLAKAGIPSAGVTYSPALELGAVLGRVQVGAVLAPGLRPLDGDALAALRWFGAGEVRRVTPCPRRTPECERTCVTSKAGRAALAGQDVARAARTLLLWSDPGAALRLTATAYRWAGERAGRVRFGIADDVRWELVAPGLVEACAGALAYAYTKHDPADRPGVEGLTLVYSATAEAGRWPVDRIACAVRAGLRVAVVVDAAPDEPLPARWAGLPAIDGDEHDDRALTPAGVVVLLRAKGPAVKLTPGGFVYPLDQRPPLRVRGAA